MLVETCHNGATANGVSNEGLLENAPSGRWFRDKLKSISYDDAMLVTVYVQRKQFAKFVLGIGHFGVGDVNSYDCHGFSKSINSVTRTSGMVEYVLEYVPEFSPVTVPVNLIRSFFNSLSPLCSK